MLARTPAAAEVDAALDSGHVSPSRCYKWMRASASKLMPPPARPLVHHSAKPPETVAPAAAKELAAGSSGHPSSSHLHYQTRASLGFAWVVSAARMVAGAAIPSPSAAFAVAGG